MTRRYRARPGAGCAAGHGAGRRAIGAARSRTCSSIPSWSRGTRRRSPRIADAIGTMPWIKQAPVLLLFCGDIRRGRRVAALHGRDHANDSMDTFLNATADAALAMGFCIMAADAAGLGTCPICYVRNHLELVGPLFGLPEGVFPVAGLTLGYPAGPQRPRRGCRLRWWCIARPMTTAAWTPRCRPMTRCARRASRATPRCMARSPRAAAGGENAARQLVRAGTREFARLAGDAGTSTLADAPYRRQPRRHPATSVPAPRNRAVHPRHAASLIVWRQGAGRSRRS